MTDTEKVQQWCQQLDHPMKPVLNVLRQTVKSAHPSLQERIKWNAPSYHTLVGDRNLRTGGPINH